MTRKRTVTKRPQHAGYVPGIDLKGEYLKQFGFNVGTEVTICIVKDKIEIYAVARPMKEVSLNDFSKPNTITPIKRIHKTMY